MSVNKAIILGNVCQDPTFLEFVGEGCVANFTVAANERGYRLADRKQIPPRTEFLNVVASGGLARVSLDYLRKGWRVYVEGKIRTRSYNDEQADGRRVYVTEIHADTIELLGAAGGGQTQR